MKMINPIVSVVMPVYNALPWINESINSILNQTFENFELIIIDDGSVDGTREFLKNINDSRIVRYFFSENRGIVSALNKGISLAKGKYIARMDSDDISSPIRLEQQVEFLEENPSCHLVATNIESFTHESTIPKEELERYQKWYNNAHTHEEICLTLPIGNCLCHPSVMFRKDSFYKIGGYKSEFKLAEDYEFFIRMSKYGRLFKIRKPLLKYRIHSKQLSSEYKQRQRRIDAKIKAHYIKEHYCLEGKENLLIWGAGNGGILIYKALSELGIKVVGFIDIDYNKRKKRVDHIMIENPESISKFQFDFVIIATTLGRKYAESYLESLGLKYGKQYIPVW
ncbi:glycosyltransferase [Geobacillus sp. MMMUD3]|nr:glycosyltransferase [Geobacillus sp. MMMUD3]